MPILSPNASACLSALIDCARSDADFGDDAYFGFAPIIAATGLDRATVRRNVRFLARKGLAEFARGLCTIDGGFAGAGYRATKAGKEWMGRA